jgi:hypothetical protein
MMEGSQAKLELTDEGAEAPASPPEEEAPKAVEEPAGEPKAEAGEEEARPTGVKGAIEAARERVERGESIVPEEEEEEGAEAEPEEGEEAEAEGEPAEEEEEGEAEDPEGEGEEEEGEEEDPDAEFVTFELPSRQADGDPVPVEIPAELEEDFARLRNGYMRGEEARGMYSRAQELHSEMLDAKAEVEYVDRELDEDPVGFVSRHVKDTKIRKGLLKELLADDALWDDEEIQESLRTWDRDPEKRALFRAKVENDRLKSERVRERQREQEIEAREGVRATAKEVAAIIPGDFDPGKAERFYSRALRELGEVAGKTGRTRYSRDEVVDLLTKQGILEGFGIDPDAARKAVPAENGAAAGSETKGSSSGKGRQKAAPHRARKPDVEEAQGTGRRLKERSKKRRSAAAYAPAGAGSPAASVELPKGQTVKERIAYVRKMGLAQVLGDS